MWELDPMHIVYKVNTGFEISTVAKSEKTQKLHLTEWYDNLNSTIPLYCGFRQNAEI